MPFTPFAGLGVLVHLLIILISKVYSWLPFKKAPSKAPKVPAYFLWQRVVGTLIVLIVFSAVSYNAFNLVKASITDKYSSLTLAENFINKEFYSTPAPDIVHLAAMPPQAVLAVETIPTQQSVNSCKIAFEKAQNEFNNSLVDYLKDTGRNYSLSARSRLAESFGMSNYVGTQDQKQSLLVSLLASEDSSSNPCKN